MKEAELLGVSALRFSFFIGLGRERKTEGD